MPEKIPVKLRDHLIPFLFQEMEGITASHDGQKVKMIRLLPSSSLANYLYALISYEKKVMIFQMIIFYCIYL